MKKTLSTILALVLALALALSCVSFAAAEDEHPETGKRGYLMYADAGWAYQYWGAEAPEGVTPINADITGPGTYTVGLEFAEEAAGLAFAAIGIDGGELDPCERRGNRSFQGLHLFRRRNRHPDEPVQRMGHGHSLRRPFL